VVIWRKNNVPKTSNATMGTHCSKDPDTPAPLGHCLWFDFDHSHAPITAVLNVELRAKEIV
jgi:hypothetical protein